MLVLEVHGRTRPSRRQPARQLVTNPRAGATDARACTMADPLLVLTTRDPIEPRPCETDQYTKSREAGPPPRHGDVTNVRARDRLTGGTARLVPDRSAGLGPCARARHRHPERSNELRREGPACR